ncbi:MAG TPA: cupin domain-containing protein [Gemmataceae bacterium]|nr:cupin domain-containing protein [Gemmataceae bacterium]
MNETQGSCELTAAPGQAVQGSRVLRFRPDFRWDGVAVADYKDPAEHWRGIARMCLVGESGESTRFQLRYFEIAPGGFSSFESHAHEHAVFVLRGRGEVQLGEVLERVGFGDVVYVAPHAPHQFRNPSTDEPFGFLCVVDAERDRPTLAR